MSWIGKIVDRVAAMAIGSGPVARPDAEQPATPTAGPGAGGWVNPYTGLGTGRDPAMATTYGMQMPLSEVIRDNLYEYESMTGIVVDRPAKDLVRRGLEFKGFEGFDLIRLKSKHDDLQTDKKISRAYKWSRKDGGSAIFVIVNDGRPNVMPIDFQRLTNVHALHVLTRREISVA